MRRTVPTLAVFLPFSSGTAVAPAAAMIGGPSRRAWVSSLSVALLVACAGAACSAGVAGGGVVEAGGDGGAGPRPGPGPGPSAGEGGAAPGSEAGASTQPQGCPCPLGAYCDLATSSCIDGCTEDANCTAGHYCNVSARTCETGCRDGSDCPSNAVCSATTHACTTTPGDGGTIKNPDAGAGTSTWTAIYSTYLAPGTPGHCGTSGCHASSTGGFACSNQAGCYAGLVSTGYISTSQPATSPLADPQQSCLTWFGGNMPPGGGANAKAVSDITAWVNAGAKNN